MPHDGQSRSCLPGVISTVPQVLSEFNAILVTQPPPPLPAPFFWFNRGTPRQAHHSCPHCLRSGHGLLETTPPKENALGTIEETLADDARRCRRPRPWRTKHTAEVIEENTFGVQETTPWPHLMKHASRSKMKETLIGGGC